jgi:hypothetical protein
MVDLISSEYLADRAMDAWNATPRKQNFNEGYSEGFAEGWEEGVQDSVEVVCALFNNIPLEEVGAQFGGMERVKHIKAIYDKMPN